MPDKARNYQGRRRKGRRREARRPIPQAAKSASAPVSTASPQVTTIQPKPTLQASSGAKAPAKPSAGLILKVTPVSELKRIGIIAGSMFVILFILAFILK